MLPNPILIVCAGNLCRSPFAEGLMKKRLQEAGVRGEVFSRGLLNTTGQPVPEVALKVAGEFGVDLSAHRAARLEAADLQRAALVLVMSGRQRVHVGEIYPIGIGKVFLLSQPEDDEPVADPIGHSEAVFREVYGNIRHLVDQWLVRFGVAKPG